MSNFNILEYQRLQLLEKLGQVAETMRQCATVADEFARTMSGKSLAAGVSPFSDAVAQGGKRKAQADDDDEGDGKKKRKTRKPRDPNAPKRPPSSYLLFQNEVRAELKAKYPELPNGELLQMISKRWSAMSDEDKEVYSKQNASAKEAYAAKKAIYDTANIAAASPVAAVAPAPKKTAKSSPKAAAVTKAAPAVAATSSSDPSEDSGSDSEDTSEQGSDDDEEEEEAPAPPPKKIKKAAPAIATPKRERKQKA